MTLPTIGNTSEVDFPDIKEGVHEDRAAVEFFWSFFISDCNHNNIFFFLFKVTAPFPIKPMNPLNKVLKSCFRVARPRLAIMPSSLTLTSGPVLGGAKSNSVFWWQPSRAEWAFVLMDHTAKITVSPLLFYLTLDFTGKY